MKKMRIIGRIAAGAAASALLLSGLAVPAQASDTGWRTGVPTQDTKQFRDTGWRTG